jgi:hypothetical protein
LVPSRARIASVCSAVPASRARGAYVIEIEHVDAKAGGEGAGAYDRKRFVTSLSFKVADGMEGPPAPALIAPKRAMTE